MSAPPPCQGSHPAANSLLARPAQHLRRDIAPGAPGARPYFLDMPSRDADGKRLSGAALRKRRAERDDHVALVRTGEASALPVPAAFADVQPPPVGVAAVEAWAAGLNLRAALAAETADDETAPRVAFVVGLCRELGRLSVKAGRSEKALKLRRLRLGESDALNLNVPPTDDPVAAVAWAYARLARLAFEAAASPSWVADPRQVAAAKALAGAGFLPCNGALKDVAERVKKAG